VVSRATFCACRRLSALDAVSRRRRGDVGAGARVDVAGASVSAENGKTWRAMCEGEVSRDKKADVLVSSLDSGCWVEGGLGVFWLVCCRFGFITCALDNSCTSGPRPVSPKVERRVLPSANSSPSTAALGECACRHIQIHRGRFRCGRCCVMGISGCYFNARQDRVAQFVDCIVIHVISFNDT
jgi:hypothetical protein